MHENVLNCLLVYLPGLAGGPGERRLAGDGPDEAGQFARNGGDGHGRLFPLRGQGPVAGAQARLRFPGDLRRGLGLRLESFPLVRAKPRGEPVSPGAFDQYPPRPAIARLGDGASFDAVAGGALGWREPEEAHELAP